jgi:hypothetical protein
MTSPLSKYMAEREAGLKRTRELRNMTTSETIKYLSASEDKRNQEQPDHYKKLNLNKFLEQKGVSSDPRVPLVEPPKPIDVNKVTTWENLRKSQKQTERRGTFGGYGSKAAQDVALQNMLNENTKKFPDWFNPQEKQEEPSGRKMGFGQGGGVANLGLTNQDNITRQLSETFVNPNPVIVERVKEVEKEKEEIQSNNTNLYIGIGAGLLLISILAIFLLRSKK